MYISVGKLVFYSYFTIHSSNDVFYPCLADKWLDSKMVMYIGLIVGVAVFVTVAIIIVVVVYRKRKLQGMYRSWMHIALAYIRPYM